MSRKGNYWDNAVAESFFKSLKIEWVYKHKYNIGHKPNYQSLVESKLGITIRRIHSTLGCKTINEFETEMYNQNVAT